MRRGPVLVVLLLVLSSVRASAEGFDPTLQDATARASGRTRSTGVVSEVTALATGHGRAWLSALLASAVAIAAIAWRVRARVPTTASRIRRCRRESARPVPDATA